MRFRVFALSFLSAYLVCANGFSTCVWHCKNDVEAHFFYPLVLPGSPPSPIRCARFTEKVGKWLFTDLGFNATGTVPDGNRIYITYPKDSCLENCWAENGPIPLEDAIYFNYGNEQPIGSNVIPSIRCLAITAPMA